MCLFFPRISLIVPLVDWVKALARAALDAIAECIADAGRFASDTFLPSREGRSPVSLSTTKELGSRHAAVLCSALMGAIDGLYLFRPRALGLYNYISSTVARWKRVVKSTCLWLLRRATFIVASPLLILRAASRLVTSWRGSFDMQPAFCLSQFLWKNPRVRSLVARLHVDALSVRRAFFVTVVILSWVLCNITLFNVHCHGASPYSSSLSSSSPRLLCQETFEKDALTDEDTFIVTDEICEPAKSAAADKGRHWASGFSWADDVEEEEARRVEVVYFFPRKEVSACQILYSISEGLEDETEDEIVYLESFEEKAEQSSDNDSDDTTLCEFDPLVSGPLQEKEEELVILHENETVLDGVHTEQRDFEITLVVVSNVSDIVLFEDDNDINVKLPVASFVGSSLRSQAPVFIEEEDLVLMTWTPDLGLLIASNVSDMGLFEGDNDTTVKLPVASSIGSRSKVPIFFQEEDLVLNT